MAMTRRLALATLTLLALFSAADAATGDMMDVRQFRLHGQQARIYMVLGALNVTNSVNLVCPSPVTVGELEAALMTRTLPLDKTWVQAMIELMGERGCSINASEPNA